MVGVDKNAVFNVLGRYSIPLLLEDELGSQCSKLLSFKFRGVVPRIEYESSV